MRILDYLISENKENVKAGLRLLLWESDNLEQEIEEIISNKRKLVYNIFQVLCVPEKYYADFFQNTFNSFYFLQYLKRKEVKIPMEGFSSEPIEKLLSESKLALYNVIVSVSVFKTYTSIITDEYGESTFYKNISLIKINNDTSNSNI